MAQMSELPPHDRAKKISVPEEKTSSYESEDSDRGNLCRKSRYIGNEVATTTIISEALTRASQLKPGSWDVAKG